MDFNISQVIIWESTFINPPSENLNSAATDLFTQNVEIRKPGFLGFEDNAGSQWVDINIPMYAVTGNEEPEDITHESVPFESDYFMLQKKSATPLLKNETHSESLKGLSFWNDHEQNSPFISHELSGANIPINLSTKPKMQSAVPCESDRIKLVHSVELDDRLLSDIWKLGQAHSDGGLCSCICCQGGCLFRCDSLNYSKNLHSKEDLALTLSENALTKNVGSKEGPEAPKVRNMVKVNAIPEKVGESIFCQGECSYAFDSLNLYENLQRKEDLALTRSKNILNKSDGPTEGNKTQTGRNMTKVKDNPEKIRKYICYQGGCSYGCGSLNFSKNFQNKDLPLTLTENTINKNYGSEAQKVRNMMKVKDNPKNVRQSIYCQGECSYGCGSQNFSENLQSKEVLPLTLSENTLNKNCVSKEGPKAQIARNMIKIKENLKKVYCQGECSYGCVSVNVSENLQSKDVLPLTLSENTLNKNYLHKEGPKAQKRRNMIKVKDNPEKIRKSICCKGEFLYGCDSLNFSKNLQSKEDLPLTLPENTLNMNDGSKEGPDARKGRYMLKVKATPEKVTESIFCQRESPFESDSLNFSKNLQSKEDLPLTLSEKTLNKQFASKEGSEVQKGKDSIKFKDTPENVRSGYAFRLQKWVLRRESPFSCSLCSAKFKRSDALCKHKRRFSDIELKLFTCELCLAKFKCKDTLKAHLQVHNGERVHCCNLCSAKFRQNASLIRHKKVHCDENLFTCKLCLGKFKQKHNLKNHLKVQCGEKPYRCKLCSAKFKQLSALNRHKEVHSDKRRFTCELCFAKFKREYNLRVHWQTHSKKT